MNLGQVTKDIMDGQRAVRDGFEQGQRERRLRRATAEGVRLLGLAALLESDPDCAAALAAAARELEIAYAEARNDGK